jgi:hypothetical protein
MTVYTRKLVAPMTDDCFAGSDNRRGSPRKMFVLWTCLTVMVKRFIADALTLTTILIK